MPTVKDSLCLLALTLACSAKAEKFAVLRRKGGSHDINGNLLKAIGLAEEVVELEDPLNDEGYTDEYDDEDYATATYDPSGTADPSGSIDPTPPCPEQCLFGCVPDWESMEEQYWCDVDTDGDSIGDSLELRHGTDPLDLCSFKLNDVNLDSISNAWLLTDCDGDCVSNLLEIVGETDPLNSCSNHIMDMAKNNPTFFNTPSMHDYKYGDNNTFNGIQIVAVGMNDPKRLYEVDFTTYNHIGICGFTKETCNAAPFEKSGLNQGPTSDTSAYITIGDRNSLDYPGATNLRPQVQVNLQNLAFYGRQNGLENNEAPTFIKQPHAANSNDTASIHVNAHDVEIDGFGSDVAGTAFIHTAISTITMENCLVQNLRSFYHTHNSGRYNLDMLIYFPNSIRHSEFKNLGSEDMLERKAVGFTWHDISETFIEFNGVNFTDSYAARAVLKFGTAGENTFTRITNSRFERIRGFGPVIHYVSGSDFDEVRNNNFEDIMLDNIEFDENEQVYGAHSSVIRYSILARDNTKFGIYNSNFEDITAFDTVFIQDFSTKADQIVEIITDSATTYYNCLNTFSVFRTFGSPLAKKIQLEVNSGFRMNQATNIVTVAGILNTTMPRHLRIQENKVCVTTAEVGSIDTYVHGGEIVHNVWLDREDEFCSHFNGNLLRAGSSEDVTLSRSVISFAYTNLEVKDFNIEHNEMSSPQTWDSDNAVQQMDNFIIQAVPYGGFEATIEATSIKFHGSDVVKNNTANGLIGFIATIAPVGWSLPVSYFTTLNQITAEHNTNVPGSYEGYCRFKYYNMNLTVTWGEYDQFDLIIEDCDVLDII
jgi:hypothetical protein